MNGYTSDIAASDFYFAGVNPRAAADLSALRPIQTL